MTENVLDRTAPDQETIDRIVEFHGHMCPGLALGVQAARIALREIGAHAQDEEVVAAVETDMCAVDAIQFLTGCTFGKGNLVYRDYGKNAYTFWRRSDGKAIRIAGKPGAWRRDPDHHALFEKVRDGEASPEDRARFWQLQLRRSEELLEREPDELFSVVPVDDPPPRKARILVSIPCESCGEETKETRIRIFRGQQLCPECFDWTANAAG